MLEPGREANETFADAEFGARLRRQPLMRRGRRMGDEALGVAKIVRDPRDLQAVEAAERTGLAALDLETDQGRAGDRNSGAGSDSNRNSCRDCGGKSTDTYSGS